MPCNEADAVRSARLKGKICMHKIKFTTDTEVPIMFSMDTFKGMLIIINLYGSAYIFYE
jgi:hypothetical protein